MTLGPVVNRSSFFQDAFHADKDAMDTMLPPELSAEAAEAVLRFMYSGHLELAATNNSVPVRDLIL